MGKMEERSKVLTKKNRTKFLILESVKLAGLMSVLLVAPNLITGLAKLGVIATPRSRETAKRSYKRLVAAGLLSFEKGHLRLTQKGHAEYARMSASAALHKPKKWDGKWRVLVFDISSKRKGLRDRVRFLIQGIGFIKLQASVWAYPYDCEDFLTLLKADLKIGKDLLYMVVDSLEADTHLRTHFKLRTDL
jgi:DNA-binding transcriptional regulator PaaX